MSAADAAVRTECLEPGEGPPMGAFALALRTGQGPALDFLPPPPSDEQGWLAALDRAAATVAPVPADLAERLAARQAALGAGPRAEANARALAGGDRPTLAVVTGQQPGLLGGPLLTFHKAAGAIALARRLDGLGGHRVVPVFWLASEDHDFDEANRAAVLDARGQPRGLRLAMEGDGRSIMDLPLPSEASDAVLTALRDALPDTERGHKALGLASRRDGEDLAAWAVRTLVGVMGDTGLVVVEPPELAPWVGDTYAWLLDNAEPIRAAVHESGRALETAGLPAPLFPQEPGATALFLRPERGGRRLRLGLEADGGITLRGLRSEMTREELRTLVREDPLRASGNVIGRVFVQNRHLPTLAYIAGPTEIAYWAQVRAAHDALGMACPLALPRPEATWVDAKTERVLAGFGLSAGDVLAGAAQPQSADEALAEGLGGVAAYVDGLATEARALLERGGRGAEALERAFGRIRHAWEKAEHGVRAAFEADAGVGRARWARALDLLRPQGKPQDRVLSPLTFAARYGLEAVRTGLQSLDPLRPAHHLVHLEEGTRASEDSAR